MAITIKIDDVVCTVDKFTLGESWLFERDYQVEGSRVSYLLWMLAVAAKRLEPSLTEAQAKAKVEALDQERIEIIEDEPDKQDPTPAADAPTARGRRKSSASAKTPAEPGSPA